MKEGLDDETATDEIVAGIPIDNLIFGCKNLQFSWSKRFNEMINQG